MEFYAPWCGHCQNLKPAYEKAAKTLAGLAKVAAVNCDEEANKPLCGRMGIQGFPTLKIVRPGSKKGKPIVEDYQGARSAKAIAEAVADKIVNHVKNLKDASLDAWLSDGDKAKAILFTEKDKTGPLIKALAIDFLGSIDFASVKSKEKESVKKYGVKNFPTFVLVRADGSEPITYPGSMRKVDLVTFFRQVTAPNPDPAPEEPKAKASSSKKSKAKSPTSTVQAEFSKASKAQKSSEFDDFLQAKTIELNDDIPMESPLPIVDYEEKPMVIKEPAPAIPQLTTAAEVEAACLEPKSGNCILLLLPAEHTSETPQPLAAGALASFAEIAEKHHKRKTHIFPFYAIPADNEANVMIRDKLDLKPMTDLEVIAINMKRKWWRQFPATSYDIVDVEIFVDAIRLGEGAKQKLRADFQPRGTSAGEEPAAPKVEAEPVVENVETDGSATASPEPAPTAETPVHNEL